MKLTDSIIFALAVATFIIAVHQTFTLGLMHAYWIFMISISFLLLYKMRKNQRAQQQNPSKSKKPRR